MQGGENGFAHVDCLVQLAVAKTENLERISGDDVNPFDTCITCKQRFALSKPSSTALAKECYQHHRKDPVGSFWNRKATLLSEVFTQNGDYSGAAKLLKQHMASIRLAIKGSRLLPNSYLLMDLVDFLKELADVHQEGGSLVEMKVALDEALDLIESLDAAGFYMQRHRVKVMSFIGRHAHLTGDKEAALKCYEQCISIIREESDGKNLCLAYMLSNSALLHLDLGERDAGIDQLEEVLNIETTVYGCDNQKTVKVAEGLRKLRYGSIETISPSLVGLGDLERGLTLAQENSATSTDDFHPRVKPSASTKKGKKTKGPQGDVFMSRSLGLEEAELTS